jgi:hypothetical protein
MLWGGRRGNGNFVAASNRWSAPMPQPNDLSRSLVALDQNSTIIAVIEMSQSSWLVGGALPGIERQPRKKLEPCPERLLAVLHRWRDEAVRAGRTITRIALAFEAGRDGFWLARWLEARGVEAHVIHPSSVTVFAGTSTGKDRSAGHRVAQAGVPGVAAWGTRPLQHGARTDDCRRGCQPAQSRARVPGRRAYAHRQPHEGYPRPGNSLRIRTGNVLRPCREFTWPACCRSAPSILVSSATAS